MMFFTAKQKKQLGAVSVVLELPVNQKVRSNESGPASRVECQASSVLFGVISH